MEARKSSTKRKSMKAAGEVATTIIVLIMGIVVGFPTGLVITASLADKLGTFELGRALLELAVGGIFGAIAGGTIALFILSRMRARPDSQGSTKGWGSER
jgi:prolipoprotein diacylglyceryltransferase